MALIDKVVPEVLTIRYPNTNISDLEGHARRELLTLKGSSTKDKYFAKPLRVTGPIVGRRLYVQQMMYDIKRRLYEYLFSIGFRSAIPVCPRGVEPLNISRYFDIGADIDENVSCLERCWVDGKPIKALEIESVEQFKYIAKRFKTGEPIDNEVFRGLKDKGKTVWQLEAEDALMGKEEQARKAGRELGEVENTEPADLENGMLESLGIPNSNHPVISSPVSVARPLENGMLESLDIPDSRFQNSDLLEYLRLLQPSEGHQKEISIKLDLLLNLLTVRDDKLLELLKALSDRAVQPVVITKEAPVIPKHTHTETKVIIKDNSRRDSKVKLGDGCFMKEVLVRCHSYYANGGGMGQLKTATTVLAEMNDAVGHPEFYTLYQDFLNINGSEDFDGNWQPRKPLNAPVVKAYFIETFKVDENGSVVRQDVSVDNT